MLSLLLAVVGVPRTIPDEAAFARSAVPIPEVGREDSPLSEWSLYTAETEPENVRQKLDRALKGRTKWSQTPLGWEYDDVNLRKSPNLRVSVAVLSGRAMRRQEAAPQKNRWTTVRITIERFRSISRSLPYRDWVLATRTEDDVAVNVPIGEEVILPRIVDLPLGEHRTEFGTPWWTFTGKVDMGETMKRIDRALEGRAGWKGEREIPVVGDSRTYPTRWTYTPVVPGERPLELRIESGRAMPRTERGRFDRNWSTVQVTARTPGLGTYTPNRWRTPL